MKRWLSLILVCMMVFSVVPVPAAYAEAEGYQDTIFDQIGDWFATLGKEGLEKERILAERKAERIKRFMEREAEKAGKEMESAGEDTKKKLGF